MPPATQAHRTVSFWPPDSQDARIVLRAPHYFVMLPVAAIISSHSSQAAAQELQAILKAHGIVADLCLIHDDAEQLDDFLSTLRVVQAVVWLITSPDDDKTGLRVAGAVPDSSYLRAAAAIGRLGADHVYLLADAGAMVAAGQLASGLRVILFGPPRFPSLQSVGDTLAHTLASRHRGLGRMQRAYASWWDSVARTIGSGSFALLSFIWITFVLLVILWNGSGEYGIVHSQVSQILLATGLFVSLALPIILVRRGQQTADYSAAQLRDELRLELDEQRKVLAATSERIRTFSEAPAFQQPHSQISHQKVTAKTDDPHNQHLGTMLSELHHALGTPLAQIDAATRLLDNGSSGQADLERIRVSVNLCWAFLDGFRYIAETLTSTNSTDPLDTTLLAAAKMYSDAYKTTPHVSVEVSSSVPGYPNSYVLACVLPLIQNAAEATVEHGALVIRQRPAGTATIFDVTSEPHTLPPTGVNIYEAGFTLKDSKEHGGLGLATVKHLLAAQDGASVAHTVTPPTVTFSIVLPRRVG